MLANRETLAAVVSSLQALDLAPKCLSGKGVDGQAMGRVERDYAVSDLVCDFVRDPGVELRLVEKATNGRSPIRYVAGFSLSNGRPRSRRCLAV